MTKVISLKLLSLKKSHKKLADFLVLSTLVALVVTVALLIPYFNVSFAEGDGEGDGDGGTAGDMVTQIANILGPLMGLVGGGLLVFGGFTAIMGYYQERPDDTSRGLRTLAVGAGLIALGAVAGTFLQWNGP